MTYKTQKNPNVTSTSHAKEIKKDKNTPTENKPKIDKALQKAQKEIEQIEKQIEQQESVLKNVEDDLSKTDYKDKIQYNSALNRYEQEKAQLDSLYKKWEEKSEVLLKTEFH